MATLDALADYVRSHSMRAEIRGGVVWGLAHYSTRDDAGRVTFGSEWQPAGVTLAAVRDWLGY